MALKPGSAARDPSTGSFTTSDQRGFPIIVVADLGATWSNIWAYTAPETGPLSINIHLIPEDKKYYYRMTVGDP